MGIFLLFGALLYLSMQGKSQAPPPYATFRSSHSHGSFLTISCHRYDDRGPKHKLDASACVRLNRGVCCTFSSPSCPMFRPDYNSNDHFCIAVPLVGFGTAALGGRCEETVFAALKAGYRSFDSASDTGPWYKSEACITRMIDKYLALPQTDVRREDIKFTSKLHPQDFNRVEASLEHTFGNLNRTFLDLYMLHYPSCGAKGDTWLCKERQDDEGTWRDAWAVLERLYRDGKLGAIGVANFEVRELSELIAEAKVKPHVVQAWFDPFHQNWALVKFCREHGIVFQAYSSLGTQWLYRSEFNRQNPIFSDATIKAIAAAHDKTHAQIVLRWLLQEGIAVIPRSTSEEHIISNHMLFDFELSASEIKQIRQLNRS